MLLRIPSVLSTEQLQQIRAALAKAPFVDGRISAGQQAQRVKNNREVDAKYPKLRELHELVMNPLMRNGAFQVAALPYRVATPFYAKYTEGMGYGEHVDDPVMGVGQRYRSDIAITIFLNAPADYDGGELMIRSNSGERPVKFNAGDAVMYPASSLHRVNTVTRGERLVAVTWAQSLVRDPTQREVLYDLAIARDRLMQASPETDETARVSNAYVNLVRMWSDV